MSMAAESSSTIHKSDSMMSSLPASIQSPLIVKVMTFNLLIKLTGQVVSGRDLLIHALNGLGHEYDPVVVLVSQQSSISFHVAQYMLIIHEQRIEHLSSTPHIDAPPSANFNFAANNNSGNNAKFNNRGGPTNGGGRNYNNRGKRGRGRWNNSNTNRPTCQICSRVGHIPIKVHLSLLNVLCRFILKLVLILCMVLLHTMCNTTII
ncbi:hypothetical protein ACOSP7_023842 [Xanthoceras sorbifolium]